jgi:ubiquinone/menaquinone biosynthesis C-methylase UbiE
MQPHPVPSLATTPASTRAAASKARFWNRVARKYAADPIADRAGYEATLRRVQALLSSEHSVLEIGCGTGSTALRLAPSTRRMLATDVSVEMIAIARQKLASQSQPLPQLRFGVIDAETPALYSDCHDAVLAFNVLHLVSDLDLALQAILPTLKPGGLFISKTPCLAEMNPLIPRLVVPLMRALGKAPDVLVFTAAQLQSTLQRHGLEIEAVERHGTQRKDIRVFIVARRPR